MIYIIKLTVLLFIFYFPFPLHAQSFQTAETAANDAMFRLEEALSGRSEGSGTNQNISSVQATRSRAQPSWVNDPYAVYPRNRYIAAVGHASGRAEAEKKALAALAAVFGQSIKSDLTVAAVYSEAVRNGIISVSENTMVRETIATSASMDMLIGAEIGNIWEDRSGTINALAYIEKEKAIVVYSELIRMNQKNIENLISMNANEKNTFEGLSRYNLAALIAGINSEYAVIVSFAGGSTASLNFTSADTMILESKNILRNIPVSLNVKGDQNNRIRDAFAKTLSTEGLRTQGSGAPYILEITVNMSEAVFPESNIVNCRFTVDANLIERETGSVLLPFNVTDREGHITYEEAKARAFLTMEKIISEKYPVVFREYIAALMPKIK